jgi:hypothetical protein
MRAIVREAFAKRSPDSLMRAPRKCPVALRSGDFERAIEERSSLPAGAISPSSA